MGLDMYLEKTVKTDKLTIKDKIEYDNLLWEGNKDILNEYKDQLYKKDYEWFKEPMYSFFEEVCYWRKANEIHNWFVQNIQNGEDDCGMYIVTKENLQKLYDVCKKVLESSYTINGKIRNGKTYKNGKWQDIIENGRVIINPEIAQELLPRTAGFFFGGCDYDEYYIEDLVYTAEQLHKILEEFDFTKYDLVYHSSW